MASHHEAIREFATLARRRLVTALVLAEESRYLQLLAFFESASGDDLPPLAVAPAAVVELVALPGPMASSALTVAAMVEVSAPVGLPPAPAVVESPDPVESTPELPRLTLDSEAVEAPSNDWLAPPTGEPDADELAAAEPELPALNNGPSFEGEALVGELQLPSQEVDAGFVEVAEASAGRGNDAVVEVTDATVPEADAPFVAVEVSEEPVVAVEASEEPVVAVEANEEPAVAIEAREEPVAAVEASEEPVVAVEASEEPVAAIEASEEPVVAIEASEEPVAVIEASEEPVVAIEASEEPVVAIEANEEPVVAVEASEEPVVAIEANEEPVVAVEANEEVDALGVLLAMVEQSSAAAEIEASREPAVDIESDESPLEVPAELSSTVSSSESDEELAGAATQRPADQFDAAEEPTFAIDAPADEEAFTAPMATPEPELLIVDEAAHSDLLTPSSEAPDSELSIAIDEAQAAELLTPSLEPEAAPVAASPDEVDAAALLTPADAHDVSTAHDEATAWLTPATEELEVDLDEQFDAARGGDVTVRLDADDVARLVAQVSATSGGIEPALQPVPVGPDAESTLISPAASAVPLIAPPEPLEALEVDETELLAFATGAAAEPDLGTQVAEQVANLPEGWDAPEPEPEPEPEPAPTWQGGWEQPPSEAAWGTSPAATNAWGTPASAWGEPAAAMTAAWDAPPQPAAASPAGWDVPAQPAAASPAAWNAPASEWGAPAAAWGEPAAVAPAPAAWEASPVTSGWDAPAAGWAAPAPASEWDAASADEEALLVPEEDSPGDWLQPVAENPDVDLPDFGGESAEAPPLASAAELLSDLAQADWARQQDTDDAAWTEPAQQPVAWGTPAPATTVIEGDHRIVLHTLEGSVKRGVATDLDLAASVISLAPNPGQSPTDIVQTNRTKALFFLLQPGERVPVVPPNARRVKVTFVDGRQVEGFMGDDELNGFFLLPLDGRTATARVFVFNHAVRAVN